MKKLFTLFAALLTAVVSFAATETLSSFDFYAYARANVTEGSDGRTTLASADFTASKKYSSVQYYKMNDATFGESIPYEFFPNKEWQKTNLFSAGSAPNIGLRALRNSSTDPNKIAIPSLVQGVKVIVLSSDAPGLVSASADASLNAADYELTFAYGSNSNRTYTVKETTITMLNAADLLLSFANGVTIYSIKVIKEVEDDTPVTGGVSTVFEINYATLVTGTQSMGYSQICARVGDEYTKINSVTLKSFKLDGVLDSNAVLSNRDPHLRYLNDAKTIGLFGHASSTTTFGIAGLNANDTLKIAYKGNGNNAASALADLYNLTKDAGYAGTYTLNFDNTRTLDYTEEKYVVNADGGITFTLPAAHLIAYIKVTRPSASAPEEKSDNTNVTAVKLNNVAATAGEDNAYSIKSATAVVAAENPVAVELEDEKATAEVDYSALTDGFGVIAITVKAEDGTTATYTLTVVALSHETGIKAIHVAGNNDSRIYHYAEEVGKEGNTMVAREGYDDYYQLGTQAGLVAADNPVSVELKDEKASYAVDYSALDAGGYGLVTITVTAEDGTLANYYLFILSPSEATATNPRTIASVGISLNGHVVCNPQGVRMNVMSIEGRIVSVTNQDFDLSVLPAGTYIVRAAGGSLKVMR